MLGQKQSCSCEEQEAAAEQKQLQTLRKSVGDGAEVASGGSNISCEQVLYDSHVNQCQNRLLDFTGAAGTKTKSTSHCRCV